MRYIILGILLIATTVHAASGDIPNQMVIPFRNVSSSTKPAGCVQGELRQNNAYVFTCNSSAHWRRITKGNGF